jgi:F420-0:gamma-glutamyl ligase
LKSYIGTPDIFGRPLHFEKTNVADSLATASVVVMGEGNEQTPLAVISDVPFVEFQDKNPTQEELEGLHIELEDDVFAPLLTSVEWKKGKGGK